jgi:hypothetical protein
MNTKQTLLIASGLSAIVVSAALTLAKEVDRRPFIVTDVAGAVHILQALPCEPGLDVTSPLTSGRIEIVPGEGLRVRGGGTVFELTHLTAFFAALSGGNPCFGSQTIDYSEIGVRLASSVSVRAVKRDGKYFFTIPKDQFTIFESLTENRLPQKHYRRPAEDVTGEIDVKLGTVRFHMVFASQLSFTGGCPSGPLSLLCSPPSLLFDGTQTVDIFGRNFFPDGDGDRVPDQIDNCPMVANPTQVPVVTPLLVPPANLTLNSCLDRQIGKARATDICEDRAVKITSDAPKKFAPGRNLVTWSGDDRQNPIVTGQQIVMLVDTTLPTVACKAQRPAGRFKVSASDDCGPAVIHFGDFILADGEVINIQLSATPGVRYLFTSGGVRYFDVGRADASIIARDVANNFAAAACQ